MTATSNCRNVLVIANYHVYSCEYHLMLSVEGAVIGMFARLTTQLLRSFTSKVVRPDEQGTSITQLPQKSGVFFVWLFFVFF